jgi:hypothetical protein
MLLFEHSAPRKTGNHPASQTSLRQCNSVRNYGLRANRYNMYHAADLFSIGMLYRLSILYARQLYLLSSLARYYHGYHLFRALFEPH